MATSPCRTGEEPLLIRYLDVGGMLCSPISVLSRPPENLSAFLGQGTWGICDIPAHPQGTHLSTGAAVFKKWGWRGFPGGPVVGDPPANAADMAQPPGWEDPICLMATKTVPHNFWARALKPTGHNYWFHAPQLRSLWAYSNKSPQQEKPLQWEAHTPRWRVALLTETRESHTKQWRLHTAKTKYICFF